MLKGISTTIDKNIIKNRLFLNRIFFSTLISFLLAALLGNAGFSQTRYVINSGGDWFDANNWIPNGIPGVLDTAEIKGGVTVTLDSDVTVSAFVIRNGAILTGSAILTVTDSLTWLSGDMTGTGTTRIGPGAGALVNQGSSIIDLDMRTLENFGTLVWQGTGTWKLKQQALIINRAGAVFEIQRDGILDFVLAWNGGSFLNEGILKKTAGIDRVEIDPVFTNTATGQVYSYSGNLRFERGSATPSNGYFYAGSGAIIQIAERTFMLDDAAFGGSGVIEIVDRATVEVIGSGATVDFPATLRMNTDNANGIGFLRGDGALVVNGTLDWMQGIITGSGDFIINGSLTTSVGGSRVLDGRTLTNNGSIYLSEAVGLANNAMVANRAGGVIEIQNNQSINMNDAIGGSIDNAGTVLKTDVAGVSAIEVDFENSGVLDIETGVLVFEKALTNSAAGIIKGNGTLDIFNVVFSNAGMVAPGASPGILSVAGDYAQTASAGLNVEIGGVAAGTEYDRLDISGSAQLNGALNVTLASNFRPAPTDTFSIMNFSSRNGQFAAENVPIINNQSMFEVQYRDGEILLITSYVYQFTLDVDTAGSGRVELSPFGGMYDSLDVVTLTAIADSGYVFSGWSGDLSGSNNPESILMDTSKNVTATFTELPKYTLTLDTVGSGGVSLSPPGGAYYNGTMVYLAATPDSGYEFIGWSGDLGGSASPDSILMDSDKNVVATFSELPQYTLTVDTTGTGTVTINPPGGIYYQGSMVALSAIPGSGHEFGGWSGDLTGLANPDTLLMDANKSVTATFNPIPPFPIITSFTPTNGEVGTEVTISGMNFSNVSGVTFNGLPAAGFVIDSDTQIRAAVPAGASSGLLGMTNLFGTGTSADSFFVWYPPVVDSFDPAYGYAGTEVTLVGSGFYETTEVLFNGISAAFVIDSDMILRAVVPAGAGSGPISVTTPTGAAQTMLHFVVVDPPQVITFTTVADARVNSSNPNSNYGDANDLRASNAYKSYLKFVVSGVNGAIEKATLRLFCEDPSADGGAFYPVDNNWEENTITWNNAPPTSGTPLISAGPVATDTWIELDITAAILGDSTYSFGIISATSDRVNYSSREGNEPPELVLETGSTPPKPQIASFNPDSASVGTEITVTGSNFSTVNAVYFNGTPAMNVIVDSDTQLRTEVPPGAASGKIIASGVFGSDTSSSNFTVIPTYNLTVNVSGSGAVALNPPGGVYDSSTVVALTAAPDPGYVFSGWSGDLSGNANPDSVLMDAAKSVTAVFEKAAPLMVNVKAFLEGPYQSNSMKTTVRDNGGLPLSQPYNISPWNYSGGENVSSIPADVVDWVLVGLRSIETEEDVFRRAAFIKSDGSIVDTSGSVEFEGTAYGDYFVVIYHRNHLSIMSNSALPLSESSTLYDFSVALSQAYGSNSMAEVETGVFAMICGDGNADGVVDESDKLLWRLENGTGWSYGKGGDFNLDGGIDVSDLNFFWRANNGLLSGVPGGAAAAAPLKPEVSTGHK